MTKIKYIFPSLFIAIIIFAVSHQPNVNIPDIGIGIEDKFLHFFAYFVFGLTLVYAVLGIKNGIGKGKLFLIVFVIGALYAFSDELHQYYVPGRESDIADFLADVSGIVCSYFFNPFISKFIQKKFEKNNV